MILVLTSLNDASANIVMDFLWYKFEKRSTRHFIINSKNLNVTIDNHKGVSVNFRDNFTTVWINKGFHFNSDIINESEDQLNNFLKEEIKEYRKNIFFALSNLKIPVIGRNPFEYIDICKFRVLIESVRVGLKIPATCYAHSLDDVRQFIKLHKKVVTKPMTNIAFFGSSDSMRQFSMYTKVLQESDFESDEFDFHFPSLVQEYINSNFEIRVFCLEQFIWCGAIVNHPSEHDSRECDYRVNLALKRIVPFNLPTSTKNKIWRLMKNLGLNGASIDLIATDNGHYYLLEVNPVGQFGFLSSVCNFNIEETIADFLAKSINNEEIH